MGSTPVLGRGGLGSSIVNLPLWGPLRLLLQVCLRLLLGDSRRLPRRDSCHLLRGNFPRPLLGDFLHLWFKDFFAFP